MFPFGYEEGFEVVSEERGEIKKHVSPEKSRIGEVDGSANRYWTLSRLISPRCEESL